MDFTRSVGLRSSLFAFGIAASVAACSGSTASGTTTDGGAGGGGEPKDCKPGDVGPCKSLTTPSGMGVPGQTVQMGPYGALMDVNVGKGFENVVQSGDMTGSTTCQLFTSIFGEDPKLTAQVNQTSLNGVLLNFALYTVYRLATWKAGEKYPVITWGNGTCAPPEGYGALLRYVASYGYVIFAANSRWVGQGSPQPMLHALDFAEAANKDSSSPYFEKLDLTKIGAMGHSQGSQATLTASSDPRILDVILFNAGDSGVPKPYLAVSADMDITMYTASGMASAIMGSSVPAAYLYFHNPAGIGRLRGHLVLMTQPERVTGPTLAWWQMMFRNDATSRTEFVGSSCTLCTPSSDYDYGEHGL